MIKTEEEIKREIEEKKLTGIPSIDRPYRKFYTEKELGIEVPHMSLTDYIYEQNKDRMNLNALRYLEKRTTYEQLFDNIEKTSKRFKKYGVKENDYVALAMPLTPELIYMLYGLDNIGASANLIDPRVPDERMQYYLNLAESKLGAIIQNYIPTMRRASKGTGLERIIDVSAFESLSKEEQSKLLNANFGGTEKTKMVLKIARDELLNNLHNAKSKVAGGSKIVHYSDFATDEDLPDLSKVPYDPNRTSVVEYTSGTTGIPKGLELTASAMNVTVAQLQMINDAQPGETILAIMPPFISYGAVSGIHNSLACGFEMILISKFSTDIFAQLVKKYKPNNIICVPSMFQAVINDPIMENEDASYIKRLIFGGDRTIPEYEREVNKWLREHNAATTLIKGGGMAEYSSCAFETPYEETKKEGIYGIPLPLVDAKIMKDDHTECGYYEIGEIYISAPQQMKGYLNNPKETEGFFYVDEEGKVWGRSGDLGYVDTDGAFIHTARKKHMIVRPDGHNVFPNEIEQQIMSTGLAKNCVVIGIKDEKATTGEYPYAFIELNMHGLHNPNASLNAIKNKVKKSLPLRDRPRDDDYYITTMTYAKEGKLDRDEIVKVLKK